MWHRGQTSSPTVAVEEHPHSTPEKPLHEASEGTLQRLQGNASSTHTIERPSKEAAHHMALNQSYMHQQEALENGALNAEYIEALQMSVRADTSGTVDQHEQPNAGSPRRIRDRERSPKLPQIIPGSHPMISADITTT